MTIIRPQVLFVSLREVILLKYSPYRSYGKKQIISVVCDCFVASNRLNCLNRVLRSAARLIGRVSKFDHVSAYMWDILHWLPLRQRIEFRVAVIGVDLGGSRGTRPPIIELVGQRYPFAPPIIQVRIFENIETTSETKTRNLLPDIYHNENNYFNYLHL